MAVINLDDAVAYAASILNAADWVTVNDVVLNSSTTVTSASAAFTDNDAGKWVSIAKGAGGNKPLVGYIDSVTNATTVVLSVAAAVTINDASMSYGGRSEDPRHPLWKIAQAVLHKDLEICNAILKTSNHPRSNFFTPTTGITAQTGAGVAMVSHSGKLRMVEIDSGGTYRVAKELPRDMLNKLLTWLSNRSSLFTSASHGYYIISDGQLYFTGDNIRLTYVNLSLTPTACQAPDEYTGSVALLAAADLFATEGDDLQASAAMAQLGASTVAELIGREVA